jgi:hypothetical protein
MQFDHNFGQLSSLTHKLADSLDYVVWVNLKQNHLFIWDKVQRENLSCIVLAYMENQVESTTIL